MNTIIWGGKCIKYVFNTFFLLVFYMIRFCYSCARYVPFYSLLEWKEGTIVMPHLLLTSDPKHGRTKQNVPPVCVSFRAANWRGKFVLTDKKMKFRGKIVDIGCLNHFTSELLLAVSFYLACLHL